MVKLNGVKVDSFKYPNKETGFGTLPKLKDPSGSEYNHFELFYDSDDDLLLLYFLRRHFLKDPSILSIPYFPYSRMDRTEGTAVFTLKSVAALINSLMFDRVYINEPHSDVVMALVDNAHAHNKTLELFEDMNAYTSIWRASAGDYVYFPDAGAEKRYSKYVGTDKILVGLKHRDFRTGKILGLTVQGDPNLEGKRVVMLDDLCSKGGTFVAGAKALKQRGAGDIHLIVTHCENSIFEGEILSSRLFAGVHTTDSLLNVPIPEEWKSILHVQCSR